MREVVEQFISAKGENAKLVFQTWLNGEDKGSDTQSPFAESGFLTLLRMMTGPSWNSIPRFTANLRFDPDDKSLRWGGAWGDVFPGCKPSVASDPGYTFAICLKWVD